MTGLLQSSFLFPLILAGFVQPDPKLEKMKMNCSKDVKSTIYDYGALTLNGGEHIHFKKYAGKHVLFVNVATYCGLTAQYPGMSVQGVDIYLISSFLKKGM
ncbi:PREDICTED: epididymal secretory glutathione peroxidase [Chrysochloris asiatica]|uniref:Epididymal secretory glutathione peroxidase n=1 Tax=Chrysochloris asiatica TaxID=185453 RepID=A0A9B0TYR5_CHRAS|nr:PREDICTED: epididymal secretory glutathione peroxidase [Chrysochloris asiatica]